MKLVPSAYSRTHSHLAAAMRAIGYQLTLVWTLVWLLCACGRPALGELNKRCPTTDVQMNNQGICGNQLSEILKMLCGKNGYHKRSIPDAELPEAVKDSHVFLPKAEAASYLEGGGARARRSYSDLVRDSTNSYQGIVCECCTFSCSIIELSQYCINPDDNLAMALFHSSNVGKRKRTRQPRPNNRPQPDPNQFDSLELTTVANMPKIFPEQKFVREDSRKNEPTLEENRNAVEVV